VRIAGLVVLMAGVFDAKVWLSAWNPCVLSRAVLPVRLIAETPRMPNGSGQLMGNASGADISYVNNPRQGIRWPAAIRAVGRIAGSSNGMSRARRTPRKNCPDPDLRGAEYDAGRSAPASSSLWVSPWVYRARRKSRPRATLQR
jgi:hypothetical protein